MCTKYENEISGMARTIPEYKWDSFDRLLRRKYLSPGCPGYIKPVGSHKGNGTHQGIWAGTLTMSPSDELTQEDMINAIKKIMRQKSCPVSRYVWYLEYTDAGTPHVHFMYETVSGGRIERKHFKRLWKLWDEDIRCGSGHRGGYHRPVHSEDDYLNYVKKGESVIHENFWEIKSPD